MTIELAGPPEVLANPEAKGLCIAVPLTAAADERLLEAIVASPTIMAYCRSIESEGDALLLLLKKDSGPEGLRTLLTAVSSLVDLTNGEREDAAKTDEQLRLDELDAEREQAEVELRAWWDSRA
jgi:hypothetical protein